MPETRFSIEGTEFSVEGIVVHMPDALPLVMMSPESATQLCLELALQLKLIRQRERDDEEIRAASYEEWIAGLSQEEWEAHNRNMKR